MSKKVSELEEFLKFLGVNSVNDIELQMDTYYNSNYNTLIPTPELSYVKSKSGHSIYKGITCPNGCLPYTIKYQPLNLTTENYQNYSETFKFDNCVFEEGYDFKNVIISKNLLKELDNKITIVLYMRGD